MWIFLNLFRTYGVCHRRMSCELYLCTSITSINYAYIYANVNSYDNIFLVENKNNDELSHFSVILCPFSSKCRVDFGRFSVWVNMGITIQYRTNQSKFPRKFYKNFNKNNTIIMHYYTQIIFIYNNQVYWQNVFAKCGYKNKLPVFLLTFSKIWYRFLVVFSQI